MDIWIFLPKNSNFVKSCSKLIEIAVHREQTTGDVDVSMMQVSVSCPPPFLRCFVGTRVAQSTVNDKSNTLHYPFALTLHSNRFVRKCLLRGKDKPGQSSGRKREEEEEKEREESGKVESHASVIIIFRNISRI